jgi:hypothetical protein
VTVSNELFHCANCDSTLALDPHGRCAKCGSDAVLSVARIQDADTRTEDGPEVSVIRRERTIAAESEGDYNDIL